MFCFTDSIYKWWMTEDLAGRHRDLPLQAERLQLKIMLAFQIPFFVALEWVAGIAVFGQCTKVKDLYPHIFEHREELGFGFFQGGVGAVSPRTPNLKNIMFG